MFVLSLSSCQEIATVTLYFERILTRQELPISKFSECYFLDHAADLL